MNRKLPRDIDPDNRPTAPCPSHRIRLASGDATFIAREDCSVLAAMEASHQSVIDVGCRGGGCGRCRVRVLDGEFMAKRMSKAHIKPGDQEQGLVLACRVFARSDIRLVPEPSALTPERAASNTG